MSTIGYNPLPEGQFGPWSNPTNKPCDDPWWAKRSRVDRPNLL